MAAIYLLRHGQASFDAADYDQLSELGLRQASLLGQALATCTIRDPLVVCGAMRRHRETLGACLEGLGAATFDVDERWNEFDHRAVIVAAFPEYADHARMRSDVATAPDPRAAFQQIFEVAMARWAGGAHDRDYTETWTAFRDRIRSALAGVGQALSAGRDAVVSTSGGPIASIMQQLMHMPDAQAVALNWTIVNASYTKLLAGRGGIRLSSFNVHQHLDGGPAALITYR
jgi:broad specificity phosphatase PhoE